MFVKEISKGRLFLHAHVPFLEQYNATIMGVDKIVLLYTIQWVIQKYIKIFLHVHYAALTFDKNVSTNCFRSSFSAVISFDVDIISLADALVSAAPLLNDVRLDAT